MKQQPALNEVIKNASFDGILLIRSIAERTSSNGKKYLDLTLCDITAEVNAKMWDNLPVPIPQAGEPIRLRGTMLEYNGRAQFRIDKMRPCEERDEVDLSRLIPVAPFPAEQMFGLIRERAEAMQDPDLRRLVLARLERAGKRILYWPAATKLHHAEKGGLLHHTSTMLRMALAVCEIYPTLDADLLCAGVILHDLCKITEIDADEMGMATDYTRQGMLIGHLVQGVAELDRLGRELNINEELLQMVEHMVLSHHDLPEYGSPKPPMFPEAEVLHDLDLMDSRIFEMDQAIKAANPGCFTERLWSLDRKLYRRSENR